MEKRMSYNDAYEFIAMQDYKLLPYFADAWSRWPEGRNAQVLIDAISKMYVSTPENSNTKAQLIKELSSRM